MGATKKPTLSTPEQYIAAVDEAKRPELQKLHRLIRKTLPEHEPFIVHGMIGYGAFHYRYASGREGDTARVALSSNKTGFSVYVSCMDEGGYLAEQAKDRLGKASVGKSCIRFKRLADIDLDALTDVLVRVRAAPGLGENTPAESAKTSKSGKTAPPARTKTKTRTKAARPTKTEATRVRQPR